ncbi:unnamed protein product [Mytilus coruscus]|uniref:Reverse transcriptase domain-containing protein n=1 Tax=Mytilus coruscus TaxID=42192 RepID=A0A6J8E1Y9_MYTCO|nr:unnamed protein product [Mytilus coruscus]
MATKRLKTEVKKGKKSHTTYKLLWEKTDKKEYRNVLNQMIATCNWNNSDVNEKVNQLTSILHKTADKVVPKKLIKLTGFKNKASPKIFEEGKVASSFKTGVITPVPKKGKDLTQATNYRGKTVTSAHGKVYKYVLIEKAGLKNINQSNLKFGFTEGLSPTMAALILSEVYSEINGKDLLFITTLDSQKAFDVVNHQILLDKLYYLGVDIEYWDVIEDMYNGVTSTVKWQGDTSLSFSIDQGVRQGGILSSHLYKQYINELLSELETHNMGISIGNTCAGCPSCADDIDITSSKNTILSDQDWSSWYKWTQPKNFMQDLPSIRHSTSSIWHRNLKSPKQRHSSTMQFRLSSLKHIQSLPNRTATSAVYLLLGALPITAELHKRQLSLLHSIAMSHNNSIREIAWRQHTAGRPKSFFKRINDILDMYQLP